MENDVEFKNPVREIYEKYSADTSLKDISVGNALYFGYMKAIEMICAIAKDPIVFNPIDWPYTFRYDPNDKTLGVIINKDNMLKTAKLENIEADDIIETVELFAYNDANDCVDYNKFVDVTKLKESDNG